MLDYLPASSSSDISGALSKGLAALGLESASVDGYASYVDVSIEGLLRSRRFGAVVPCRRIWDGLGRRLALVLLFDARG